MRVLRSLSAILVLALFGCGVGNVSISISPGQATVSANAQVQFSASVGSAGNKTVLWSATGGTVTDTGLFTAPALPTTCYVVATSQADPSRTATAVVTVVAPVVITPGTATLAPLATQTFTAVVTETGDTNVTWSIVEGASGGTITSGGVYTAPTVEGTYHVLATGVADPTKSATAPVTVVAPVAITPNPATVATGGTQLFTASVRSSGSTTMTWSVVEGAAGGTIDATGLYTAPAAAGAYHVLATSVAEPTKSATAVVNVN